MPFDSDFISELYKMRYAPRYTLESVLVPTGSGRVNFGGDIKLSSFHGPGSHIPALARGSSSFSGGVLRLRDWSCTPVTFTVGLMANAAGDVIRRLRRGQAMALRVGWNEDPATFATVALGALVGLSFDRGAGWQMHFRGLEGSLNSRFTETVGEGAIGHDFASTAVDDAGGYGGGATLTVDSTTGFRTDGQGTGAVAVTDDNGAIYYVTYTGTTATTFTGCTAGAFGTSHATTSDNAAVTEVAYTNGHPIRCIQRLLTSTGTANYNGTHDILPYPWAMGIDQSHVTTRDADYFVTNSQPASGSDAWDMVIPSAQDNPQTWINSWLNGGGYFLTQFRGNIAPRAAVLPSTAHTGGHFTLTDALIAEVISYNYWDPSMPAEHDGTIITDQSGGTTTLAAPDVQSLPMLPDKGHTLGGVYDDTTNRTALRAEVRDRIAPYDRNTAEILKVRCRGWFCAHAAPGDTVDLEISGLIGADGYALTSRIGLILRCSANWFGSDTIMEIATIKVERLTGN